MPLGREQLGRLDERLVGLARQEGALRLRLGQLLEALGRDPRGQGTGHAELGFLRFSAYVHERCELGTRWAQAARRVARRLEGLPALRSAVARGQLAWSKAELLAEIASYPNELDWLAVAERLTVRQLGDMTRRVGGGPDPAGTDPAGTDPAGTDPAGTDDEAVDLELRVDQEDFWLWQVTRSLFSLRLGTPAVRDQGFALLAEAHTTLLAEHPEVDLDPDRSDWRDPGDAGWRAQRAIWQAEAEQRCEAGLPRGAPASVAGELAEAVMAGLAALDGRSPSELDAAVRAVARALAVRDFELGRGLLELHRADGWRRLGYASERQYAVERLGISRSLLFARRALALRLERLPVIAAAFEGGELGVEAVVELVRVATPATATAWVERARRRTVKMLREEVEAANTARRVSGEVDCPPPSDCELEGYFALERAVMSGAVLGGAGLEGAGLEGAGLEGAGVGGAGARDGELDAGSVQTSAPPDERAAGPFRTALASLAAWLEGGLEGAAAPRRLGGALRGAGRIPLRLRLSRPDYEYWHGLERAWRCASYRPMSFLRFACLAVWRAWRHVLRDDGVLGRDRGRCSCPVCDAPAENRHHLVFRSQGGGDEATNLIGTCPLCHLEGIHSGRLIAEGTAGHVTWTIGRTPVMRVVGRERVLQ